MVTAYYGKNWGKIWRRELLPQFFTNSHEIWHRCLPLGVDVQDTFFDSGRKCVAMVTAYYGKNGGKILRRELLPQFFTNSHEIWHRCLPWGVDVQDTFFDSGRKCVAMVTAYYTVKKYCGAGVLITFSDISSCFCFLLVILSAPTLGQPSTTTTRQSARCATPTAPRTSRTRPRLTRIQRTPSWESSRRRSRTSRNNSRIVRYIHSI